MLTESCCLVGRGKHQDAHFTLLPDNTVRVLIYEGSIVGQDRIDSARKALQEVNRLLARGWLRVATPRRTEEEVRREMGAAVRIFSKRKASAYRVPDPDANLVPPARALARQRERLSEGAAKALPGSRLLPGGAIETNRRKH